MARVWSIDAWANPEGWDYNDRHYVGNISLPENATNEDIINALYDGEFIKTKELELFSVEDYFNGSALIYEVRNAETYEPLYVIELEEE